MSHEDLVTDFQTRDSVPEVTFSDGLPTILLPKAIRQEIMTYCQLDTEFAWMSTVEQLSGNRFLITGCYPTKQEASPEHATLLGDAKTDLLVKWDAEGPEGRARIKALRCWCHSHHKMPVFTSIMDSIAFKHFLGLKLPWFIQGIFNCHGDAQFTVYLYGGELIIKNAPWIPVDVPDPEVVARAKRNIEQNLKVVPPPSEKEGKENA